MLNTAYLEREHRKRDIFMTNLVIVILFCLFVLYRSIAYFDYSLDGMVSIALSAVMAVMRTPFFYKLAAFLLISDLVLSILCLNINNFYHRVSEFAYRYRYGLGIGLLLVLVAFNVSGSSIGMWVNSLPEAANNGLVFGIPRECRTDEWALFTGMTFAQFKDLSGQLPYIGSVLRGCETDMFILYGQPVFDFSIIFRPFQIGYLVFGLERGLSFYWYSRLIFLFLTSLDLGMILFDKNKTHSLIYALFVAFAPVVSWWFSINNFIEMLVSFNVIILGLDFFFSHSMGYGKVLCTLIISVAVGCFVLSMYPAWMIPLFYLLIFIVAALYFKNRQRYSIVTKWNFALIAVAVLFVLCSLVRVLNMSGDAISAELSTVYPGARINTGGGQFLTALRYPISVLLPFLPSNFNSGLATGLPDNLSMFYDFFPLGIALFLFNRESKKDHLSVALFFYVMLLSIYCFVGIPEPVARFTLMGKSIPERALVILSFANLLLVFRCVLLIDWSRRLNYTVLIASAIFALAGTFQFESGVLTPKVFAVICVFTIIAFSLFVQTKTFARFAVAILLCTFFGVFVNPVQQGLAFIEENPLISAMEEISQKHPDSKWIASVGWKSNLTLFAGVKNLSSTNIYPNDELWRVLDPEGQHEDVWNRYAHLHADITDEESSFDLVQVDVVDIHLNPATMRQLGVKFVLNEGPLFDDKSRGSLGINLVNRIGNYYIYELI